MDGALGTGWALGLGAGLALGLGAGFLFCLWGLGRDPLTLGRGTDGGRGRL